MTTNTKYRRRLCSKDLHPAIRLQWSDLPQARKRDITELARGLPAAKKERLREVALTLEAIERAGKIPEHESEYHELQRVEQGLVGEALRLRTA